MGMTITSNVLFLQAAGSRDLNCLHKLLPQPRHTNTKATGPFPPHMRPSTGRISGKPFERLHHEPFLSVHVPGNVDPKDRSPSGFVVQMYKKDLFDRAFCVDRMPLPLPSDSDEYGRRRILRRRKACYCAQRSMFHPVHLLTRACPLSWRR